jgi:hypothetical protein
MLGSLMKEIPTTPRILCVQITSARRYRGSPFGDRFPRDQDKRGPVIWTILAQFAVRLSGVVYCLVDSLPPLPVVHGPQEPASRLGVVELSIGSG